MSTPVIMVAVFTLFAVVVGASLWGLYALANPTRTAQDRLRELGKGGRDESFLDERGDDDGGIERLAERLGALAKPQDEEAESQLKLSMQNAGYRGRHAADVFGGVRVALALGLPMMVLVMLSLGGGETPINTILMYSVGSAAAGYYVPTIILNNSITKRQEVLLKSFPDALDLLCSSVEAGLGLDAAFRRVAAEIQQAAPDLSQEFQLVNHEISAGVPRVSALRHLEQRTGLEEVRSLVNMLAQAERFGTSVAKSLRTHSAVVRKQRMSRAEAQAAAISPKLTVVMILFLMPVLMSVLLGPAAIKAAQTFGVM